MQKSVSDFPHTFHLTRSSAVGILRCRPFLEKALGGPVFHCKTWRDVVACWLVPVMLLAWPATVLHAQASIDPTALEQYQVIVLTEEEGISPTQFEKAMSLASDYASGYVSMPLPLLDLP
jgi:hypothetical protein